MLNQGLLVLLQEHIHHASPAEHGLCQFVLDHTDLVVGMSIHELAQATFTSGSTVSRLCRRLGLAGYKEFQRAITYDLALLQESEQALVDDLFPTDTATQIAHKVTARNAESLMLVEKLNSSEVIEQCVEMMYRARRINLFGMGASLLSGRDLHDKLLRIGVASNLMEDWHGQLLYASNSTPEDLSIAISYSGATQEVLACSRRAKEQGAPLIAITRIGHDSPLVRLADKILFVPSNESLMRSGAMASRISQLGVVDIIFTTFVSRNYERYAKVLEANQIEKSAQDLPGMDGNGLRSRMSRRKA